MKTNIVGTVIVLSLIIWIPASCIVSAVVSIFSLYTRQINQPTKSAAQTKTKQK